MASFAIEASNQTHQSSREIAHQSQSSSGSSRGGDSHQKSRSRKDRWSIYLPRESEAARQVRMKRQAYSCSGGGGGGGEGGGGRGHVVKDHSLVSEIDKLH